MGSPRPTSRPRSATWTRRRCRQRRAWRCRLADRLTEPKPIVDAALYAELRKHFDAGQILALGAALSVASGWQRFIEAFGIRSD